MLAERDPQMAARLMPADRQRIVRALEVLESTGRSLADWQGQPGKPVLAEAETVRLLVLPDRPALGQSIDARFDAMLAAGALDEVRALLALGSVGGAADHAGARGGCAGGRTSPARSGWRRRRIGPRRRRGNTPNGSSRGSGAI